MGFGVSGYDLRLWGQGLGIRVEGQGSQDTRCGLRARGFGLGLDMRV